MDRKRREKVIELISKLEEIDSQIDELKEEEKKQRGNSVCGSDEEHELGRNVDAFCYGSYYILEAIDHLKYLV